MISCNFESSSRMNYSIISNLKYPSSLFRDLKRVLIALPFFTFVTDVIGQKSVDILIVGGGGGGGFRHAGGGGAGGVVVTSATLNSGTYTVTVGDGGNGATTQSGASNVATDGGNSSFNGSIAYGGGAGGDNGKVGNSGGSGGGGANGKNGGNGTTGQGNKGGNQNNGAGCCHAYGCGGGGAGAAGANTSGGAGSNGGVGISSYITGSLLYYGGGGAGGSGSTTSYTGGSGGGGDGGISSAMTGENGIDSTGGGGGGGGANGGSSGSGGHGGSGIVIIRYASTVPLATGGTIYKYTGNGTNGTNGVVYQVHKFKTVGNSSFVLSLSISAHPSTTASNICLNGVAAALTVTANGTSPTYQWYSNTTNSNTGGTLISGATTNTYTPPTNTAGTTYYYCRVTTTNNGTQNSEPSGAITINSLSVAGTISGGNSVTTGTNSTVLTLTGNTGSIFWQVSSNNTAFARIASATSATYTASNLTQTRYYRVALKSGACDTVYSNTNAVIVNPAPTNTTSPNISVTARTLQLANNVVTGVDSNLTMSFTGNLSGFTVTISENYTAGDVLSYTGTLPSGVTAAPFNTQSRSLTFTGSTSAANWQALLRTVTIRTTSATCNPETRKVSFTASTNFYNFYNGHYYEYVSAKKNWTQARDYAASKSFYGRQGYLVVISSAEENAYISQMIGQNTWLGGTDNYKLINAAVGFTKYANQTAAEGKYHWVTGPEKGVNFSNGNGSPSIPAGRYCRWQSGEPNNFNTGFYDKDVSASGEHYVHIYSNRKTWNDFPNDRFLTSIIEYGDMPGDNPQGTVEGTRNIVVSGMSTGTITGASTVCAGTNSTNLTLTLSSGGSTVARWEKSEDDFIETTTNISSTSTSYTATNLSNTTYFRAAVVNGSCTTVTKSVKITVLDLNPGDIIATTDAVCTGQQAQLRLNGHVGTVQKWQTTTNTSSGTINDIVNTTTSLNQTISPSGTYYFRAVVSTSACVATPVYSDWYAVTGTSGSTPTGGSVSNDAHCSVNNSGTLNLTGASAGSYTWQTSTNGGNTWTSTSVTTANYSYSNIAVNTLFRVLVNNGCNSAYSDVGSVNIYGTGKSQWTGTNGTNWGTKSNWCNDVIPENGADFDISPDAVNDIHLDRNRTVGTVNFNGSGRYIYLNNYRLTLSGVTGGDSVNHFKTNGTGELRISIADGDSFTFHVGAATYNPVTIKNSTNSSDIFMVRLLDNVYDKGTSGVPLQTPRVKRTWLIDKVGGPANSGSGISMAFDWHGNDVEGTINSYRLYHFNGNSWDKQNAGTYSSRERFVRYQGYKGTFSPFGLGDQVTLLPVNWLSMGCSRVNEKQALVQWATASETQSDSFVVERSLNGQNFTRVGAVKAAGNSSEPRQYSLTDNHAVGARAFYRVKQTDLDGESSNSEICSVLPVNDVSGALDIYPNPANDVLTVVNNAEETEVLTLRLIDMAGKEVMRVRSEQKSINLPVGKFETGLYLLSVEGMNGLRVFHKIVISQ